MMFLEHIWGRPSQVKQTALTTVNLDLEQAKKNNGHNPFMTAARQDSARFMENYGVNRPLRQPMFLGYRDDKALYGGSKLFILY